MEYNKQDVLKHLSDMFSGMSLKDLRVICEQKKWSLDSCIDAIIDSKKQRNTSMEPNSSSEIIKDPNFQNFTDMFDIKELVDQIKNGYRVLIIMRGAPGSGKSFLASEILRYSFTSRKDLNHKDFIFSADDYFCDKSGVYKFKPDKLDKAHSFNQDRVRKKAVEGWSPLIVDNTNIYMWQMMPYVKIAVTNGYIIKILEPNTPWRLSASKLALKNKHNVPRDTIQRMIDNFEKASVGDLLKIVKTSYTDPIPQMRNFPPISETIPHCVNQSAIEDFNFDVSEEQKKDFASNILHDNSLTSKSWKPYEEEFRSYWFHNSKSDGWMSVNSNQNKSLLDLLKENISDQVIGTVHLNKECEQKESSILDSHTVDCPNENKSFYMLRQIYPKKDPSSLWDLFVKCKGDIDWVVDILLKEEERFKDTGISCLISSGTRLECKCGSKEGEILNTSNNTSNMSIKPQRDRIKIHKVNQTKIQNAEMISMKKNIENIFVFPEKNSLQTDRKSRNFFMKCTANKETQTTFIEEENDDLLPDAMLELTFGKNLVHQLHSVFKDEISLFEKISEDLNTTVFIPRTLAKQMFLVWVESAYNQMEEKQQETLRQDEVFARLLKNPDFENCKETPENIQQILDVPLPWSNFDNSNEKNQENRLPFVLPTDLATHLSTMKLCEMFPNIPKDTLIDILAAHGNDYTKTVDLLHKSCICTDSEMPALLLKNDNQQVLPDAMIENAVAQSKTDMLAKNINSKFSSEDLKHLALREFEETRNIAAHHCQLKAECFEKAKEAFQKGNGGIAAYYSQIASLHKQKIDLYNQKAANCIVEVHRHTQCNPDLLDLHYLHVAEAVECLDIFLDQHITTLRMSGRIYKHVFLITGRGLHSIGGVSSIKKKVKTRLKERHLRWTEVNPGLLKVKLYSSSKHTTYC